jgi:hypothetical protein
MALSRTMFFLIANREYVNKNPSLTYGYTYKPLFLSPTLQPYQMSDIPSPNKATKESAMELVLASVLVNLLVMHFRLACLIERSEKET